MVAFSFVLKVPQILAIGRSGSCAGLSTLSFELEQVGLSIHTAYGFLLGLPFNAFGEVRMCCSAGMQAARSYRRGSTQYVDVDMQAAIILVQNTILLGQIYYLSKTPAWRQTALVGILVLGLSMCLTGKLVCETTLRDAAAAEPQGAGRVSEPVIRSAYEFNNVIFTAARLPQIIKNFQARVALLAAAPAQVQALLTSQCVQAKSTGQLSSATFTANFVGCLARIFTSWKEGGGASMVRGYILGARLRSLKQLLLVRTGCCLHELADHST